MSQPGKVCDKCRQTVPEDSVWCNYCGNQFVSQSQIGQPTQQLTPPNPYASPYPQPQPQPTQYVAHPQQVQVGQQPAHQGLPQQIVVNVSHTSVTPAAAIQKSKIVAALLALFLGGLGIHGFYLGNTNMGVAFLVIGLINSCLVFVGVGFITASIVGVVLLVQMILYLVASDADFHQKYVISKAWF